MFKINAFWLCALTSARKRIYLLNDKYTGEAIFQYFKINLVIK